MMRDCEPIPEPDQPGLYRCSRCGNILSRNPYAQPPRKNCPALASQQIEPSIVQPGAGAELHKLLAEAGFAESAGCGCKEWMVEMDRRGVEWCRANRGEIIAHLVAAAAAAGFPASLPADLRPTADEWLAGLSGLLDAAIAAAELTAAGCGR